MTRGIFFNAYGEPIFSVVNGTECLADFSVKEWRQKTRIYLALFNFLPQHLHKKQLGEMIYDRMKFRCASVKFCDHNIDQTPGGGRHTSVAQTNNDHRYQINPTPWYDIVRY